MFASRARAILALFRFVGSRQRDKTRLATAVALSLAAAAALTGWLFNQPISAKAASNAGERIYALLEAPIGGKHRTPTGFAFRDLGSLVGARRLALGETGGHIIALTEQGTVWAWGANEFGQLGVGDAMRRTNWTRVEALEDVIAVAAGTLHSAAVARDGSLWTWGANDQGQLGDGSVANRFDTGASLGP